MTKPAMCAARAAARPRLTTSTSAASPPPASLERHGRVDAPSVGGADARVALAPVALLGARVEDEDVLPVALDDHGADGADDDDHAARLRDRVGRDGSQDLLGELFPGERVADLLRPSCAARRTR